MSKHELYLALKSDEETGLKPVRLYGSSSLTRLLYYALKIFQAWGVTSDYSEWIEKYEKEKGK